MTPKTQKIVIISVITAALAAAGYFLYKHFHKTVPTGVTSETKKNTLKIVSNK